MRRGEIWWADIPAPRGSEPGYSRPVLVVQTDPFNESAIRTVVVVVFTSNLSRAAAPGNVLCRKRVTGLREDSVANVSQLASFDKSWLRSRICTLPQHLLRQVEAGLRQVLGL